MHEFMNLQAWVFMIPIEAVVEDLNNIEENQFDYLSNDKLFKTEEFETMAEIGINDDHIARLANWIPEKIIDFD